MTSPRPAGPAPERATAPRAGTLVMRDERIVYVSDGLAALTERAPAELLGRSPLEFLGTGDAGRILDLLARDQRGERVPRTLELLLELPGGRRRKVECHVEVDGGDRIVHVRDLEAEERRRALLQAMAGIGIAIRSERSVEAVHARTSTELGAIGLACLLMRTDGVDARVEWFGGPPALGPLARAVIGGGRGVEGLSAPITAFARRILADGAAFTDDWTSHVALFLSPEKAGEVRTRLHEAGFSRALGARIDDGGGGPAQYLVVPGPWRGEDVPAIRLFGAQVAAAVDAARAITDLSRRNADLGVLARIAALAGVSRDLGSFFAEAESAIRPVVGCDRCAVFVADATTGDLVCVYTAGDPPIAEPGTRLTAESPLAAALQDLSPRLVSIDAGGPPHPAAPPLALSAEPPAAPEPVVACIPLVARSRAVGLLAVEFRGGAALAGRALELLSSAGAHLASAIESHHLVADLRHRVSELTLLVDVARASAQLDPVLLLESALRRICDTVHADAAVAYLREADRLVLLSATGVAPDTARDLANVPAGAGPAARALACREPVEARADAFGVGRARTTGGATLGPCVAVPLLAKAETVGAIVLMRVAEAPFAPGEVDLLLSIGVQLGIAVDAARLFADVRRRLADLESVHALAVRVFANAPGDAPALLQDGCREMLHALSARTVAVFLSRGDGVLRLAASVGIPPEFGPEDVALGGEDAVVAEVLRTRAPLVFEDFTRDPRSSLRGRTDVPPLALLAVPLGSRDEVRGLVYVADAAGRRFSPSDVALANAMASALGLGIENAGLYAETRRRVEELSLMNEAGRGIARSLDLAEVLHEAVVATQRLVGAERAWVLLYDGARGEVRLGAGTAPVRGLAAPVEVAPASLLARVLHGGGALRVDDLAATPEGEAHRAAHGGRSLLAVPVVLRGEPLGVLCVDEEAPRRFDDSDVQRVTAIADRLAVAIENARLYHETRRRAEEVALMHEVGRSLVQTLDFEQVLSDGVRTLARIVDAPAAYLALLAEDGQSLVLRAAVGEEPGGSRVGDRVPLGPPSPALASLVYSERLPVMITDARSDPRVTDQMRSANAAAAYLGLPLVARDQVIGTAVIVERRGPRAFTPAEMERAAAVANQLAVAADNARLYERLRSSYAALERAQRQLLEGERLAALGELSAIVAHEVRNPLGVIFNSLGPLRRMLKPTGDARLLFNIVEEESDRLNRIVGDLLDFARPSTPELSREDLGRIAEDAVTTALGQPDGAHVELASELAQELPPVTLDARQVRQAVLNVAVNAVQAMPRGGRITLRTRRDGAAAVVEIEDTGGGIPAEVRGRVFEPFFTTKASGTGLGLAVVKRIVEGHGGSVSVGPAPGGGTLFTLRFPL